MFTLFLGAVLLILLWLGSRKDAGLPPGPPKLPLLGSLAFINPFDPLASFRALAKKHGKLMTVYFGNTPVVVFNEVALMKEGFQNPVFAGKHPEERGHLPYKNSDELLHFLNKIHDSKEIASYVKTLSPSRIEQTISNCLSNFINRTTSDSSGPMRFKDEIDWMFYEAAWDTISEYAPPEGDALSKRFLKNAIREANDSWISLCTDFFPRSKLVKLVEKTFGIAKNIVLNELILLHLKTIVELWTFSLKKKEKGFGTTCFAGKLFSERKVLSRDDQEEPEGLTETVNLIVEQGLQYFSGSGALSSSVRFAIQNLALHADWQARIQGEVDSVIGADRKPNWNDMNQMPLLVAFIKETLRHSSIIPFGVQHCLKEEIKIENYCLPKDTVILANIDWVHHDDRCWRFPDKFSPERFLGKEETANKEYFHPFSLGSRSCLGEPVVMGILFLTLTGLVQHFHFSCDGRQARSKYKMGVIVQPVPFKITLGRRRHGDWPTNKSIQTNI